MSNVYVALPVYIIIDVADEAEGQRAKQALQQLLNSDMGKFAIQQTGFRVHQTTVADPYPCAAPAPQQQVQQQLQYPQQPNGRR